MGSVANPSRGDTRRIATAFDAARDYEAVARVQARSAGQLSERIAGVFAGRPPERILEFGCGTGLLTAHLATLFPRADILATDLSPNMVARARRNVVSPRITFALLDAEAPALDGTFDLICSNFCLQWVARPAEALRRFARHLRPGGRLMVTTLAAGSFREWRACCDAEEIPCGFHDYPALEILHREHLADCLGGWDGVRMTDTPPSARVFLKEIKQIGAGSPARGAPSAGNALRRAMNRFDRGRRTVSYEVAMGIFAKNGTARGVFVTGTDTGVGKTVVSAVLARAWGARYWKPLQTGLADEAGDTPTVLTLAQCDVRPPAYALAAPLAPLAAAHAEGVALDVSRLALPADDGRPLVVEGAGGLMVPVTEEMMMIDLIAAYGLPVVLVARSGLGTINHTLLSLGALRSRGIPVAGVVLNGPENAGNRQAIERFGNVRILAELPPLSSLTCEAVAAAAGRVPEFAHVSRQDAYPPSSSSDR